MRFKSLAQGLASAACALLLLSSCEPWSEPAQPYDPSNGLEVNGEAPPPLPLKDGAIHPKAFEMIECWASDSKQPVALEINLDAVEANRDQFDYAAIIEDGGWHVFKKDNGGFLRCKTLKREGRNFSFLYQSNGGGSLSFSYEIEARIDFRTIAVDGKESEAKTLKVLSFKRAQ